MDRNYIPVVFLLGIASSNTVVAVAAPLDLATPTDQATPPDAARTLVSRLDLAAETWETRPAARPMHDQYPGSPYTVFEHRRS